jgi:hypothetical protein
MIEGNNIALPRKAQFITLQRRGWSVGAPLVGLDVREK